MRKTLTVQIPKPCKEDWNSMIPKEKGRHCQVCSKTVFDFTTNTDEEIIQSFEANPNLCGRFKNTQLNRELVLSRKSKNNYLSFVASSLFAFLAFQPQEVKAQGEINIVQTDTIKNKIEIKGKKATSILKKRVIHGTVTDENGLPLPTASIIIKGTTKGTSTDFDGNFSIQVKPSNTIIVGYVGYSNLKVNIKTNITEYNISLKPDNTLDEIVITGRSNYSYSKHLRKSNRKIRKKNKKSHRQAIRNFEKERTQLGKFFFNISNIFIKKKD